MPRKSSFSSTPMVRSFCIALWWCSLVSMLIFTPHLYFCIRLNTVGNALEQFVFSFHCLLVHSPLEIERKPLTGRQTPVGEEQSLMSDWNQQLANYSKCRERRETAKERHLRSVGIQTQYMRQLAAYQLTWGYHGSWEASILLSISLPENSQLQGGIS